MSSQTSASTPVMTTRMLCAGLAETADPRDLVRLLHDALELNDEDVARAAGVLPVTVRRWRSRSDKSKIRRWEHVDDLRALTAVLASSGLLDPDEIRQWLRGRNSDLDYQRPLDLIRVQEFDRVLGAAETYIRRLQGLDGEQSIPSETAQGLPEAAERMGPSQSGSELATRAAYSGASRRQAET